MTFPAEGQGLLAVKVVLSFVYMKVHSRLRTGIKFLIRNHVDSSQGVSYPHHGAEVYSSKEVNSGFIKRAQGRHDNIHAVNARMGQLVKLDVGNSRNGYVV